jgi:hypothetical protein
MATQKEIAQFFRLALRLRLVDTVAVERWVDSVIAAESAVRFPFTDLAGASHRPSSIVDDLLGQHSISLRFLAQGRISAMMLLLGSWLKITDYQTIPAITDRIRHRYSLCRHFPS